MKAEKNKINISADFITVKDLFKLLKEIGKDYEEGVRNKDENSVKWFSHKKYTDKELWNMESLNEKVNEEITYEERGGVTYMQIQSKLNFM